MSDSFINIKDEIFSRKSLVNFVYLEFNKLKTENRFFKNVDSLLLNAEKVKFSSNQWNMNPKQFCLDHYGEQDFYLIILMINNIRSYFDFYEENIKDRRIIAPLENKIRKISQNL